MRVGLVRDTTLATVAFAVVRLRHPRKYLHLETEGPLCGDSGKKRRIVTRG